ncbi:efflux RND transporter periplasmic adaptor subunit [Onishia taeanensis]
MIAARYSLIRCLALLVPLSLALAGCDEGPAPLSKQQVHPVKLVTLAEDRGGMLKRYPAVVQASERSDLAFRIGGELEALLVQSGERVSEGQPIARLDDRDASSQLASARSSFDLAKATFERMRYSVERGAISRARFDEARAEFLSAEASLAQARDRLDHTELAAPFAGVIAKVPVENFQVVSAQQTIATLHKPGRIDVRFQLPEQQVRRISREAAEAGQESPTPVAWVRFGADEARYPARYKEHDTSVSEGSLSYGVTLALPEPDDLTVLSGMSATVVLDMARLTGAADDHWRVPVGAVVTRDSAPDRPVVWRYVPDAEGEASEGGGERGRVEAVPVATGTLTEAGLLVRGPLAAGDRLVAAGAQQMSSERRVRPWVQEEGL